MRVLILCTGNSARSQVAEGLLRRVGGGRHEVFSAGTKPSPVRPEAIAVMKEIGIDISRQRSKSVDEFTGQEFDYVITVCATPGGCALSFPARPSDCIGGSRIRRQRRGRRKLGATSSAKSGTRFMIESTNS